jgi:hypothetical protein
MNKTYLLPTLLVSLLSGCASMNDVATTDPVRQRVLAELEQAKADGLAPVTEAHYLYPWPVARAHVADASPLAGQGAPAATTN